MRALPIAAALLLLSAPARADWEPTHWGMSVDELVATYPGAKAKRHDQRDDFENNHLLATGKGREGEFAFDIDFYFDPAEQRLAMVRLKLRNPRQCLAFLEAQGVPPDVHIDRRALGPLLMTNLLWKDAPPGDQYFATSLSTSEKARDFSGCWLQIEQPRAA
jgi:hypothetical protein